jgi:hypothetical protein
MRLLGLLGSFVSCILVTGARAQNVTVVYGPMAPPPEQVVIVHERPFTEDVYLPTQGPRQTAYLIAFKNSEVSQAQQYWVSGNTLYYVTPDHRQRTAPLDSVDRALSQMLNSEQDVAFYLPAGRATVQARLARTTGSASRSARCCCVSTTSARASSPGKGKASRAMSK